MSRTGLYCWTEVTAAVFREFCDTVLSDFRTLLTELENDQLVVLPRRPWLNTLGQTYFLDRFWTPTKLWDSILPAQPRDGGCFYTTLKVLPWVVVGAGGLGAGKTSGAGTRGVSLDVVIGGRTGDTDTNGGESSDNRSKVHADCGPAENPSL